MTITSLLNKPYSAIVYKSPDNTYVAKSDSGKIILTHATDPTTVFQAAIDSLGSTSGKKLLVKPSIYTLTAALNFSASGSGYITVQGESNQGLVEVRAGSDLPVFSIVGKAFITLDGMRLTHNVTAYSSALVELKDGTTRCTVQNCSGYDFGKNSGSFLKFDITNASVYGNWLKDCFIEGFGSQLVGNCPNSSFFCNGNFIDRCNFWNYTTHVLKVTSANSSCAFDGNCFSNCVVQTLNASSGTAFDYDSAHIGHSFYTMHDNVAVYDLGASANYADINGITELTLTNCLSDYKIGGSGAANLKFRRNSFYGTSNGTATVANATTSIAVNHGRSFTPSLRQISVTPTNNMGNATKFWVSNPTSTQFTINVNVDPGATTATFVWYIHP